MRAQVARDMRTRCRGSRKVKESRLQGRVGGGAVPPLTRPSRKGVVARSDSYAARFEKGAGARPVARVMRPGLEIEKVLSVNPSPVFLPITRVFPEKNRARGRSPNSAGVRERPAAHPIPGMGSGEAPSRSSGVCEGNRPWMSPNHINLYGLVTSMVPNHNKFTGFRWVEI